MCSFTFYLFFYPIDFFILGSHVFGTGSDPSDLNGSSQTPGADDVEDEFETIRRQRSAKRARIASQRSGSLEV